MMFPSSELLVLLNQLLEKIMEGEIFQNYDGKDQCIHM